MVSSFYFTTRVHHPTDARHLLAVDNVLERFIKLNAEEDIVPNDKILRVATDSLKVNKALRDYTIDARVGGDVNENNRLVKKAQERVKSSKIVFTTCAGAGLGILRKVNFEIVIIDEASQITEACALIPLVKGCKKGVLVGDQYVAQSADLAPWPTIPSYLV
jgi:superfamily I DNA and/or RNA helicase